MNETDLVQYFVANAPQIMWFLGAGTSRTAGMPTAMDITWDLKVKYYCRQENQNLNSHDLNNAQVRRRVQSYCDAKGFPPLWSNEEYSHYFEIAFGQDYAAQQRYLADQLDSRKISLNIGHKALAGLITLNKARIIFTTNFDDVIEAASAKVANQNLTAYHLEGSYAALEALNTERFPIYAKIHGDFKYQSVKNLSQDLLGNDVKLQQCFIASASRYGLVVSGYSGRDNNVMSMFYQAIEQPNAFPLGLFWTTPALQSVADNVKDFIAAAQLKGINAHIIDTGTFDTLLSKIWRQIPEKPHNLDDLVMSQKSGIVNIPFETGGTGFPIIRLNGLPITGLPQTCALIEPIKPMSGSELKNLLVANKANAAIGKADNIYGWGNKDELIKALGNDNIANIVEYQLSDPVSAVENSTHYHSFFERGLAYALCNGKPLLLRKSNYSFYIVVDWNKTNDALFNPLKAAIIDKYGNNSIAGSVPRTNQVRWAEAAKIKLEYRNGKLWLMINPTIWIDPQIERQNQKEFTRGKRIRRYNNTTSAILDAWIKILVGDGRGTDVKVSCYDASEFPCEFTINTRTAYSHV